MAHIVCITPEEDFLKCLRPTYLGEFGLKGRDLRLKGQNRIGNLIVENRNYCEFEDWLNVSPESLERKNATSVVRPPSLPVSASLAGRARFLGKPSIHLAEPLRHLVIMVTVHFYSFLSVSGPFCPLPNGIPTCLSGG